MRTDPAIGKAFFAPKKLLAMLRKRLADFRRDFRQNVALIGYPGVGKSSVLRNLARSLSGTALVPIYVNVVPEAFPYFANRYMGAVLLAALSITRPLAPEELNAALRKARRLYPRTVRAMRTVRSLVEKADSQSALSELFSLPRILAEEKKTKCVLFLDEFDTLGDLGPKDPFGALGREVMIAKDTLFVMASSRPFCSSRILREKLALLFGRFETVDAQPMTWEEAEAFLAFKFRHLGLRKRLRRFLYHLSGGIPLYLDALTGRGMTRRVVGALATLRSDVFVAALRDELFSRGGWLHQYFQGSVERIQKIRGLLNGPDVLMAMAKGQKSARAAARWLSLGVGEVKRVLSRLIEEDVLVKQGTVYAIPDPLFRFWLADVLYPRRLHVGLEMEDLVRGFEERLRGEISGFMQEEEQALLKRLEALLRCFGNERVQVGEKSLVLPAFEHIESQPSEGAFSTITGRSAGERWILQVAEERVSERQVRSFVQGDARKGRRKVHRVLLPLKGIELDACILAKEANIGIWDRQTLWGLFDLYGKPRPSFEQAGTL